MMHKSVMCHLLSFVCLDKIIRGCHIVGGRAVYEVNSFYSLNSGVISLSGCVLTLSEHLVCIVFFFSLQ